MQDLYQPNTGDFQAIDSRVRLILTLGIIIFINLVPNNAWPSFILFLAVILSMAIFSSLNFLFLVKRSLFALPFALAAVPLMFMGPPPFFSISILGDWHVNLSYPGCMKFIGIFIKCCLSIQVAILFTATTRFQDVVIALKQLKVPALFTDIIGLMWRYFFVIADEVRRMMRARSSRSSMSVRGANNLQKMVWMARVTGGMAGSLFLRSLERSDRVYAAMTSRGYSGNLPAFEMTPIDQRGKTILFLGTGFLISIFALGLLTGG